MSRWDGLKEALRFWTKPAFCVMLCKKQKAGFFNMDLSVQYLFQSGFCVGLPGRTLLFDVCTPGDVPPQALEGPHVDVFVSHSHSDHFHPGIFQWRKQNPDIHYILSDDIPEQPCGLRIGPRQALTVDGVSVTALRSTDLGVAFLLNVDGLTIYHAGDLNWWHWDGEDPDWNRKMDRDYQAELARLDGVQIDLAFVPLDPRLGRTYLWGLDAFMQRVGAKRVVPMHFGDDYRVFQWLQQDPRAAAYRGRVAVLHRRGQVLSYRSRISSQ